jgi:hypothetical protein
MKKNYTLKFFSFIAGVLDTAEQHLFAIISANFLKKIEMARGQGDTYLQKNLKSKISCQNPFKGLCGVVDSGGNLRPVLLTPVANLPLVSTTLRILVEKFAAVVVDTGGKFAAGVIDTGGAP